MNRWVLNRTGLVNFWYYQNQIFEFANGHMLLRGTNGSGKSLTMQSLFPVLFDGDTSAYRLDSFGSRDRKMEDYLLGEKDVSTRDEGIGYLFLEVKREQREEYLTIGIGMHANRGGKLIKWFFAIENNQRIGQDFHLFEQLRKDEFIPLTKKRLKNRLEGVGRLFDTQKEYKQFVNERLFGFEDIEQFDELIALLINLRSPKLSKEFRPSVIYGILRDSLPKLKEDDLLSLSKTIEQLDGHRERLVDLGNEIKELRRFTRTYTRWHDELVGQLSMRWLTYAGDKQTFEKEKREEEARIEKNSRQALTIDQTIEENENQLEALEQSIQELSQHEGMDLVLRGQELQETLANTQQQLQKTRDALKRKQEQLVTQEQQLESQLLEEQNYREQLGEWLEDNEQYRSYLRFEELDRVYSEKMQQTITKEEYAYWQQAIKEKRAHLQMVIEELRKMQQLREQLKEMEREVGQFQQKIDEQERDLRQWQQTRKSEIEHLKDRFDDWQRVTPFPLGSQAYGKFLHGIDRLLDEEIREEEILAPIRESYEAAKAQNQKATIPLESQVEDAKQAILEKEVAIKEWQAQKMPVPERSEARQRNREGLAENYSFISFYQSVDFLDEVTEEERDAFEGALYASGILDALLSEEGLTLSDDVQIYPQPQMLELTLLDFLKVNPEVNQNLQPIVTDVLQSILVDPLIEASGKTDMGAANSVADEYQAPAIHRDGTYQIANLQGQKPLDYQASFIGVASQERYRQLMIQQLEEEIQVLTDQIGQLEVVLQTKAQEALAIEEAYQQRPTGGEIYQAIAEINRVNQEMQIQLTYLTERKEKALGLDKQLTEQKIALHQQVGQDGLQLSQGAYEEALVYLGNYEANVRDAYRNYEIIQTMEGMIANLKATIVSHREEEENYFADISQYTAEEQKQQRQIEENRKQQKLVNVEELQAQLQAAKKEQGQRKDQQKTLQLEIQEVRAAVAVSQQKLVDNTERLTRVTEQEHSWHQLLEKEIYRFATAEVSLEALAKEKAREINGKKLRDIADEIIAQFGYLVDQLQNYQPKLLNRTAIEVTEELELRLGEFSSYNNTKEPVFSVEGQSLTAFDLLERLASQQLTLQDLLKKDDEALFKKIILESVGTILKSRIDQAMKWVEQMNDLLQSQKNSSGLSLSIQWKGITSSSDNDLGTVRLVSLLQKDEALLSEADRNAISRHFQEKVSFAQEQLKEDEDDRSTLFQAISKVLDYRDWFDFELKFKRANEGYRAQPLTDRRFNQFSGGEKAVSMYLPLFAAMYSRYGDARDDCPRVITLDEAFAGIDDQNIEELFKACEQLGFNYVMNSQALFGDYSTVSSLMIYELLRPQNDNVVTAIRYYWDGRKKQVYLGEANE